MKKLYSFLLSVMIGGALTAATINVTVTNNAFTPQAFNANVGDVVVWSFTQGTHNVTSSVVPSGASSFMSGNLSSGTFSYTITTAGTYGYFCSLHGTATSGMVGGFQATSTTGIAATTNKILDPAYPNPFKNKVTISYPTGATKVTIFNVIGSEVANFELEEGINKAELDLGTLNSGVYFYSIRKENAIVETKKIVKE